MKKIIFFLIILLNVSYAGEKEALETIIKYKNEIIEASKVTNVSPRIIAATIYAEHSLNFKLGESILDYVFAKSGYDASIGVAQIKVNTARWIEQQVNNPSSEFYLGREIQYKIIPSKSWDEEVSKLEEPKENILYAAAYLAIIIKLWDKEFTPIGLLNEECGITASLYSLGIVREDGSIRRPHPDARMNNFGKEAQKFYNSFLLWDYFPS